MPPPLFPQNKSHLKTLVICHYVIAGLYGLGLFFIILHFAIMSAVFMNPEVIKEGKNDEFIQVFVPIMGAVYGSLILVGLALIVLNILSARYLTARKKRTFSMVTAGMNCLGGIPGVALAVCTFIVLCRDSVKAAYEKN